ncbi:MAG TPA: type VI secretion system tip protein TssI/VgrG, partial [Polyangiales bacterium]|nr:type VI secretion system tip protein TssI/VgrG [Polyangiales bacterium]
ASEQGDDPAKLIGQPCSLVLRREAHARCVHGIVTRIAHGESGALRVTVMPALEALRHRTDSRIFQDKTVPEVLDLVLAAGLAPYRRKHTSKLRRTEYPKREYIVQFRESDLAFVERLMAEEGIWYRFEQSGDVTADDCELLTLFDANDDAPEATLGPTGKRLPVAQEHDLDRHSRVVHQLSIERKVGPTQVAVAEANWSHPDVPERGEAGTDQARPHYEPYGVTLWGFDTKEYRRSDAIDQARLRWEQLHGRAEALRGHSNLEELAVGMRIVVDTGSDDLDGEWVITELHESGSDTQQGSHGGRRDYANRFVAQRFEIPLRPARRARPRVHGVALAHVVGADGRPSHAAGADDIETDEHGRVRVKMTWDRSTPGEVDATTTCWLRVAQMWSGGEWGSCFLPRIGMEVVVGFVDGDPDRPLVTGCVYNGLAKAPYPPHEHKTKSYIRTQSSPGGGGYNELLFDDAKDQELVSLRAQRDHREHVLRNQSLEIGGARAEHVQGAETVKVQGARSHTVHGAETLKVVDGSARLLDLSGDDTKLVAKNRELVVSQKTSETHVGGRKVLVQSGDSLEVADGAHKQDHITGQYNIVADEHFKVQQGDDQLYMKDTFYVASQGSVQLKNGGFHLRADANGTTTIDVGKQLTIRVGNAQIQLKSDGSVLVSGSREAKLVAGPSELALKPAGSELKAAKVNLTGSALVEVKAPMITLN